MDQNIKCQYRTTTNDNLLIDNFKFKYEEIKYVLDMKIKEFNRVEENNKVIIERLAVKLKDLEKINSHLKEIIFEKEKESDKFVERLRELNYKLVEIEKNNITKHIILEKEKEIETLNNNILILNGIISQKDEIIKHFQAQIEKLSDSHLKDEIPLLENNKEDIDFLKEKNDYKYNKIKEKNYLLKKEKVEAEKYVKSVMKKYDKLQNDYNNYLIHNNYIFNELEEKYTNILQEKDRKIINLEEMKNNINKELELIKCFIQKEGLNRHININDNTFEKRNLIYGRINQLFSIINKFNFDDTK